MKSDIARLYPLILYIYLFLVGRVFTGLFHAEDDEVYKEKEDEVLPGSYQWACRD